MNAALGILEFTSIAKGYFLLNEILKKYPVTLVKSQRICPGRFMIFLHGNTEDINNIINDSAEYFPSVIAVPIIGISDNTVQLLSNTKSEVIQTQSLGIIELKNAAYAFLAADKLYKKYSIQTLKLDYSFGLFGKGLLFIAGTLSDIYLSKQQLPDFIDKKYIVNFEVISNPESAIIRAIL